LTSVMDAGIASISLDFDPNFYEVDDHGNKTTYKSIVSFYSGKKSLVFDLWFKYMEPEQDDDNQCPIDEPQRDPNDF
ncbi:MAG: hypothetical protein HRT44_06245, partial [Bdellovibrionales bacterium]|nr:hypothetical protein [Bdellovibrionales bacterium]NQZ18842.1 hypothetical protein [Bdellovibrionales bacterium]